MAAQKNKIETIGHQSGARVKSDAGRSVLTCITVGFAICCRTLPTLAETGTVQQCFLSGDSSFAISPIPQHGSYSQPITITVDAFALDSQHLEANLTGNTIAVTISGSSTAPSSHAPSTCGRILMNPIAAGTYTIALSVIRDGQSPVVVQSQTITVARYMATPPTPPPVLDLDSPPVTYDFVSTQAVGDTAFKPSVSADGAALVSVPIEVPPGRQGVQPALALSYSSRNGDGPLGVGWQLSGLSSIMACRRSPAIDGSYGGRYPDRFCLDGQRLVSVGDYEFRTETDSARKIVAYGPSDYPDSFDVYSSDGMIWRYGSRATSNAKLEGQVFNCVWGNNLTSVSFRDRFAGCQPAGFQRRAWMLDKVEDRFGNSIEIDYHSSEHLLPAEIRYTQHASVPGSKKIVFEYESRPDRRSFSMSGLDYTAALRLKAIKVLGPLGLSHSSYARQMGVLRQYELFYAVNPVTFQSELQQILECAGEESDAPCKSPLSFTYTGTGITYQDKALPFVPAIAASTVAGWEGFETADINGDGFDDLLYRALDLGPVPHSGWYYRLSDGQSFGSETATGLSAIPDDGELRAGFVSLDRNETVDAIIPTTSSSYLIAAGNTDGTFAVKPLDAVFAPGSGVVPPRIVGIGDLNGDTLPDLIVRDNCGPVLSTVWCRLGTVLNQPGPFASISFGMDTMIFGVETRPGDPAFVVDIDGNGVNEVISPVRITGPDEACRNPDCNYSVELKAIGLPIGSTVRRTGLSSKEMPRFFLDVNGDGLIDSVHVDNGQVWIAMNKGGSYGAPQVASISSTAIDALSHPNEVRIADFNNDGLEDIYLVSASILLQSDGQLGFAEKPLRLPSGDKNWTQTLDFNGDGLVDFVQVRSGQTHVLQRTGPAPALLERITGGPLSPEVRFIYKSTPEVHTPGPCVRPQTCLNKGMWLVSEVGIEANVSSHSYPASFDRTFYSYKDGRFDTRGRGWLGFAQTTSTNEQTGKITTAYFDNTTRLIDSAGATYRYPGAFRPVQLITKVDARLAGEDNGKISRSTTRYTYQDQFVGASSGCPCVASGRLHESRTTDEEASAQGAAVGSFVPLKSRRSIYTYNLYGLTTNEVHEVFEGAFGPDGLPPPSAKLKKMEVRRVPSLPDQTNWLIQRYDALTMTSTEPAREAIPATLGGPATPAAPQQVATRTTNVKWQPGTMRISRLEIEPGSSNSLVAGADVSLYRAMDVIRDRTGNINTVNITVNSGFDSAVHRDQLTTRTVRIDWDSLDQTFPHRLTNEAGQTSAFYYHAGLGRKAVIDDPNHLRTVVKFDRFGRPRLIDGPSSADLSIDYSLSADGLLTVTNARAGGTTSSQFYNKWGSSVRTESSRLRDIAVVKRTFTRFNQLATVTFPYYQSQPGTVISAVAPPYVAFTYDNLGRIRKRMVLTGGFSAPSHELTPETESWRYDGLVEYHTNARGIEDTRETDAASRVIRAARVRPTSVHPRVHQVVTRYEYGPFDLLESVTDPAGNRIENRYDVLGRLINRRDPSGGYQTIKYNGYGERIYGSNGAGSLTITRDALGRIREQTYKNPAQTSSSTESFVWDVANNGIGKLASATSFDGITTKYGYDAFGRPSSKEWDVGGSIFKVETVWDSFDRLLHLKYPSIASGQLVLEYAYDNGILALVRDQATQEHYWRLISQDSSGTALSEQFGTSITTNRALDARKRLSSIATTEAMPTGTPPKLIQQLSYDYGLDNLIRSRSTVLDTGTTTENFEYDFLNRLEQWTVNQDSNSSKQTYGYDDLGNLTSMTVERGIGRTIANKYGPAASSPNAGPYALRENDENGTVSIFQYDSAGRQVSGGNRSSITWNVFDLPTRIQSATNDINFQYDASHGRAVKTGSADSITYIGGIYERHAPSTRQIMHVFNLAMPGRLLGQIVWQDGRARPLSTNFFHFDALGTPETISDPTSNSVEKVEYEPFGQRRNPSALATPAALLSTRSIGFTGHESDDEFGLINMRGRIYDPNTARFLTRDPFVQAPFFSQSLNRYAYVFNNPINFVDPTGFQCAGAPNCIEGSPTGGGTGTGGGSGGPIYDCGSWNPFACLFNFSSGGTGAGSSTQQQTPTRMDASRQGADAGAGWGDLSAQQVIGGSDITSKWGLDLGEQHVIGGPDITPGWGLDFSRPRIRGDYSVDNYNVVNIDAFVFSALTVETPPVPLLVAGSLPTNEAEAISVFGISNREGPFKPYAADIFARGIKVGSDVTYGSIWGGKEIETSGSVENIVGSEGSVGKLGGVFTGSFEVGPDAEGKFEKGLYIGVSRGRLGEHGSLGFGFVLPSINLPPARLFEHWWQAVGGVSGGATPYFWSQ